MNTLKLLVQKFVAKVSGIELYAAKLGLYLTHSL